MTDSPAVSPLTPPEATNSLIGHEDSERALLDAYRSARLHHAWMLEGPPGIGKATLAYRFARFVLANPDPLAVEVQESPDLGIPPDHSVARQVAAHAHPNLMMVERPRDEEGKPTKTAISVDIVRRLDRFLGSTPAGGNWRVVVVDPADELTRSAANALLKMLEEPPERCIFLLIAHMPGRLLPTIRSRCRRLALPPLPDTLLSSALGATIEPEDRDLAVHLARGSLGQALRILGAQGKDTARETLALLNALPDTDRHAVHTFAERLGQRGGDESFRLACDLLLDWIASRARGRARDGVDAAQLARWSEVWEKVGRTLSQTETYNLDRTQAVLSVFRSLTAVTSKDAALT